MLQQACECKLHFILGCPSKSKHLQRHREAYIEGSGFGTLNISFKYTAGDYLDVEHALKSLEQKWQDKATEGSGKTRSKYVVSNGSLWFHIIPREIMD